MNPITDTKITFESLSAMALEVPHGPQWRYFAITPECYARLVQDPEFRSDKVPVTGIEIQVKHGQSAMSWGFGKRETFLKYMSGEISEADLLEMNVR